MKGQTATKMRPYTRAGMLRFFLKGSLSLFAASIVCNLFSVLFTAAVPQIVSFTVDSVIGNEPVSDALAPLVDLFGGIGYLKGHLGAIAAAALLCAALIGLFQYLQAYFNARANQTLAERMRNTVFSHVLRLPLAWHRASRTGDVIQRCTSDADTISNFISGQLVTLVRVLILTTLSLTLMFLMNVPLGAIAAAFVPVLLLYSLIFYKRMGKHFLECDENEALLSAYAQENFSGVRVVRAFGRERSERDKFERQNTYYTGLWVRTLRYLNLFWISSDLLLTLQLMTIIAVGTVFCVQGNLTAGQLLAFVSYNTLLMDPVRQLGRIISNLSKAGVSIDRLAELMNVEEEEEGAFEPLKGDIVFDGVRFSYGDREVLKGVSFRVPEGTTLGIIGGTGSGKSTLAALLDGLYPLDGGDITIGGRSIKELSPATVRGNVGLILQEGHLFSRTVGENIAIATHGAGQDEIERYAKIACVHENVMGFARGYDTVVGERGVTLSGGQKQRVAIARTLLRKTPYLIFDDSLSAVDSDTDVMIRNNLRRECAGSTVIVISHRISTVMDAENILVLEDGNIKEQGTHEELLKLGGTYRRLFEMQTEPPEAEPEAAALKEGEVQDEQ